MCLHFTSSIPLSVHQCIVFLMGSLSSLASLVTPTSRDTSGGKLFESFWSRLDHRSFTLSK